MPTKDLGVSKFPATASLIFLNGSNYIAICTFSKIVILSNTPLSSELVFIFGIILYTLTYFFLAVYARIFQQRILWKKTNLFNSSLPKGVSTGGCKVCNTPTPTPTPHFFEICRYCDKMCR